MILLTWKAVIITFGGVAEVKRVKNVVDDTSAEREDDKGQPFITASPLDYHVFRQEITSKYPAYNPPAPMFPLEPEIKSILPPVRDSMIKDASNQIGRSGTQGQGSSILHQPVHIATPAPSPPPSPAGPGKQGKKQNYQTNQNFPFLYPPLDETSNTLGGRGETDLLDTLVGRKKWEGTDIPRSIVEAAELFAKRMRATRSMKQLWEERVQFMKYERGWRQGSSDADVAPLDISSTEQTASEEAGKGPSKGKQSAAIDEDTQRHLDAVECFYVSSPGFAGFRFGVLTSA